MEGTTARPHLVLSELDGELIVLDTSSGDFYSLNPTATQVWKALDAGTSLAAIAAGLVTSYGIDPAQADADVRELVAEFQVMGLRETGVESKPGPEAAVADRNANS